MITETELRSIFSVTFQSDNSPVVYRKHTTDTIPTYALQLSNSSDAVYITVYTQTPEYVTITNIMDSTIITETQGVLLAPLSSVNVVVTLDPVGIDMSPDSNPKIIFDLQAMEVSESTTTTGGSGGGSTGDDAPRRRRGGGSPGDSGGESPGDSGGGPTGPKL